MMAASATIAITEIQRANILLKRRVAFDRSRYDEL
jgi:hypothetical protein